MGTLPRKLSWPQAETQWATLIDPVLGNALLKGVYLTNMSLKSGSNTINHLLQRTPQGWFLVSPQGTATVYQAATQLNPTLTLTLIASADVVTNIWVF